MDTNFITSLELRNIYKKFIEYSKPQHYISACLEVSPNNTFSLDIYYTVGDSSECHEIFYMNRINRSCMYDVILTLSNLTYTFDFNFYLA